VWQYIRRNFQLQDDSVLEYVSDYASCSPGALNIVQKTGYIGWFEIWPTWARTFIGQPFKGSGQKSYDALTKWSCVTASSTLIHIFPALFLRRIILAPAGKHTFLRYLRSCLSSAPAVVLEWGSPSLGLQARSCLSTEEGCRHTLCAAIRLHPLPRVAVFLLS
jgi:hypothetical protein